MLGAEAELREALLAYPRAEAITDEGNASSGDRQHHSE